MPELCASSKLPTPPRRLRLREATSGKPGGRRPSNRTTRLDRSFQGDAPHAPSRTFEDEDDDENDDENEYETNLALERKIRSPWARAKAAALQVPPLSPWRLPDTPNDEAFGFKRLPDLGDLIALDFDGPIFHRTTGAARRAQFLSRFLDL